MKERQIPFQGEMVRAIIAGRKTQTRRMVKMPPISGPQTILRAGVIAGDFVVEHWSKCEREMMNFGRCENIACHHGVAGDRLWVREAWRVGKGYDELPGSKFKSPTVWYCADYDDFSDRRFGRYRHARFMPRWASRITLEITGVRVERLQDISEADAAAEGVEPLDSDAHQDRGPSDIDRALCENCGGLRLYTSFSGDGGAHFDTDCRQCDTHVKRYRWLWESINGPGSWALNPWVWVVEFRKL